MAGTTRMKLYVLDCGRMQMDKSLMLAGATLASRDHPNRPAEWIEFPIYAVYIDHPDGKIVFDTGCNPNAMGPNGRWPEPTQNTFPFIGGEECYLPHRLEQLNVGPDDIRYVVVSHLHLDHAGCLEYFRKSQIIVHDDELSGALKLYAMHQRLGAYIWEDIDAWIRNELHWRPVQRDEGDLPLVDGVTILNFGSGHAFGMLGLHVQLPETGGVILASDAIYCSENYGPPVKPSGILYDSLGYVRTVERIRRLAGATKSQVWFGHDAEQFATLIKSTEGYYE